MTSFKQLREIAMAAQSADKDPALAHLPRGKMTIDPTAVIELLDRVEAAEMEVERLSVNRDHSCTCPHGDAREPIVNHDKACPIRVNKIKRIAPEVALSRIAAALDSGDENDELQAENVTLRARADRAEQERDELRASIATAREAHGDPMTAAILDIVRQEAERSTASAIAVWLDERDSPYLSTHGADRAAHDQLIASIRAGAWKRP